MLGGDKKHQGLQLCHDFWVGSHQKLETLQGLACLHEAATLAGCVALPLMQVLGHGIALFSLPHLYITDACQSPLTNSNKHSHHLIILLNAKSERVLSFLLGKLGFKSVVNWTALSFPLSETVPSTALESPRLAITRSSPCLDYNEENSLTSKAENNCKKWFHCLFTESLGLIPVLWQRQQWFHCKSNPNFLEA